jgi:hypothetical protein
MYNGDEAFQTHHEYTVYRGDEHTPQRKVGQPNSTDELIIDTIAVQSCTTDL